MNKDQLNEAIKGCKTKEEVVAIAAKAGWVNPKNMVATSAISEKAILKQGERGFRFNECRGGQSASHALSFTAPVEGYDLFVRLKVAEGCELFHFKYPFIFGSVRKMVSGFRREASPFRSNAYMEVKRLADLLSSDWDYYLHIPTKYRDVRCAYVMVADGVMEMLAEGEITDLVRSAVRSLHGLYIPDECRENKDMAALKWLDGEFRKRLAPAYALADKAAKQPQPKPRSEGYMLEHRTTFSGRIPMNGTCTAILPIQMPPLGLAKELADRWNEGEDEGELQEWFNTHWPGVMEYQDYVDEDGDEGDFEVRDHHMDRSEVDMDALAELMNRYIRDEEDKAQAAKREAKPEEVAAFDF